MPTDEGNLPEVLRFELEFMKHGCSPQLINRQTSGNCSAEIDDVLSPKIEMFVAINSSTANSRKITAPNWREKGITPGKFIPTEEDSLMFHVHSGANLHTPLFEWFS